MSKHQSASYTNQNEIVSYDLYDDISDLIQGITLDGRFLFVNKAWCDALGYSRSEVAALNVFDVIHADCHEHCQGVMQKLIAGEEMGQVEVSFVTRDGRIIDVEGRVTMHAKAGQPMATCGVFRDVSERKAAEKEIQSLNENLMHLVAERTDELQKSEARFRDFIANIPGAMYELVVDVDGHRSMPYISDGVEELLGLKAASCMADVEILLQRIPHDVLITMEESMQHSLESLSPWLYEFPVCTVAGEQKWLYSHALPKKVDGATYWSGMLVDITSRKQIEETLHSVTDRLSLATRASGVGIWDWDIARNMLTWDEAMFNLFGVSRHDFDATFEAWRKTVHPDDLQQAEMAIQSALHGKTSLDIEFRIIKPDGSVCHIIGLAALQFDDLGQPIRMIGTNMDVTKQRQSESRLLQAKEKAEKVSSELGAYIEAIGKLALVSVADLKGRITHANAKFCEISGYSEAELLGQDHRILNSGIHPKEFFREMWVTIKQGNTWRQEVCNRNKSGQLYWVDSTIAPLKNQSGQIISYLSIRIDITERKRSEARVMEMATHDLLTGLPNRYLLRDRMTQVLARIRRSQERAAILFVDLDNFKLVNDSMGHDVGDMLLKEVAAGLMAVVRDEDTVARQGGDEFIVLLPDIDSVQDIEAATQKLLDVLSQSYRINNNEVRISGSIGIAVFPADGEDVDTLLKNSDIAMYHAKENGGNNYQFFDQKMNQLAAEKHALSIDLHHALERNELLLYFQPVIEMPGERMTVMEVLLRWNHPEHGLVSPLKFVPIAEENGLIVLIGRWVLRQACLQIKKWQSLGYKVPKLAINVSARQFLKKTLLTDITDILAETGVSANQLVLEITESMLMDNAEETSRVLHQLNILGFGISVDDFGTGYSSLSYLKRYPIDTLKIDRSFVRDIATDPDDAAISTAIIALAHSLKIKVVAEGVETKDQLNFLRQQGCDRYQGFYFSKPLSAEDIEKML